jgi:hypothetical protein
MSEQRRSYHLFTCPNCESQSHVIWPKPRPSYLRQSSKIKVTCPQCKEPKELYVFLLDRIMRAPEAGGPTVEPESISAPDPKPDPDAKVRCQQEIFLKRATRFALKLK